jgi:hypothetical protein
VLPALTKPLESLTAADLQELTERQWSESENVEYKGDLHRENNRPDPWYTDGDISRPSKFKIFKELVAFANTSGGRLFLGVTETHDRPPRADTIHPIPRCCDLAERLEQSIINSIDPPLTFLRVVGVPTDGDSGVVVAEVPASYNGPHMSPDLRCYVRKGTNSVPVTMREIHDIVMRLSRRQDDVQAQFAGRRERFEHWVGLEPNALLGGNLRTGFRVTAVPVSAPLHLGRVFNNREVSRPPYGVNGKWVRETASSSPQAFPWPVSMSERPVLGGTAWISDPSSDRAGEKTILRDGLTDIWFRWPWYKDQRWQSSKPVLHLDWIVAASAEAIASADAFRRAVQSPGCEYGVQLELLATNGPAEIPVQLVQTRMGLTDLFDSEFETPAILGPYSIGDRDLAMNSILRDLLDASGEAGEWPRLEIDWSSVRG